jgi:ADP-L-glycero-D-manno-heptose 6-epimerase
MIYQLYTQMKAGRRPRVFRAGEQRRDFVYVKDAVAMTMQALAAPRSVVYNCGSGRAFSFNEVIAELNRNLGTAFEPEYFENPYDFYQPHTEADMSRAQTELHFTPQYPPVAGIADYVAWLESRAR